MWTPSAGRNNLGDRMLSMTSAFLYALLTGRVLLAHVADDMAGLFCEPFSGASWELPRVGFPLRNLMGLRRGSERSYGNMAAASMAANDNDNEPAAVRRSESNKSLLPPYVFVHLERDYQLPDQRFFCDDDQAVLARVNCLVLRSDLYFAPGLFLVPQFEDDLRWMFPAADTVFHHVGRYLFHPSNRVWELVARYYTSYMSNFEKIGLQIAAVSWNPVPAEEYIKQIAACTTHEKILPEVDPDTASSSAREVADKAATTAVLVSAAQPQFADWLKAMYSEHATATGEAVSVLQLNVGKQPRNQRALAEMFLQSYCDVSVVSGWSTVLYVSHGLAGVKPWLLLPPSNVLPCVLMTSMEPFFHVPPNYDCRVKKSGGLGCRSPACQALRGCG
jgi:xyloglucan fucosyltransferase